MLYYSIYYITIYIILYYSIYYITVWYSPLRAELTLLYGPGEREEALPAVY